MSDNKQYYTDFAHELAALYNSFISVGFDDEQSFELVKICISNPHNNNNFYAQLEMKRRSDKIKAALDNANLCKKEGEENHA